MKIISLFLLFTIATAATAVSSSNLRGGNNESNIQRQQLHLSSGITFSDEGIGSCATPRGLLSEDPRVTGSQINTEVQTLGECHDYCAILDDVISITVVYDTTTNPAAYDTANNPEQQQQQQIAACICQQGPIQLAQIVTGQQIIEDTSNIHCFAREVTRSWEVVGGGECVNSLGQVADDANGPVNSFRPSTRVNDINSCIISCSSSERSIGWDAIFAPSSGPLLIRCTCLEARTYDDIGTAATTIAGSTFAITTPTDRCYRVTYE